MKVNKGTLVDNNVSAIILGFPCISFEQNGEQMGKVHRNIKVRNNRSLNK